jgi:hypothetical protein
MPLVVIVRLKLVLAKATAMARQKGKLMATGREMGLASE